MEDIRTVLREEITARDDTNLVASTAESLQARGNGGRGFELDDELNIAHVDTELEAGGRDNAAKRARLQSLFDLGASLLRH